MRRQTGYEDDWINALNGVTNLANTLSRTKATGLQIQNAEDERDRLEKTRRYSDYAADAVTKGEVPNDVMGRDFTPGLGGPGWQSDYNSVNIGAPSNETVSPDSFTRSGDKVEKGLMSTALTNAMQEKALRVKVEQDDLMLKYKNIFLQKPLPELLNTEEAKNNDFSRYGKEASAASRAFGEVLRENYDNPRMREQFESENAKYAVMKGREFEQGKQYIKNLIQSGKRDMALQVIADFAKNSNMANRVQITPDGKIQRGIMTKGVMGWGPPETAESLLAEMDKMSAVDFAKHTYFSIKHNKEQNDNGAKDPEVFMNAKTGEIMIARPWFNPRGGDEDKKWIISTDGTETIIPDLGAIYKQGFVPAGTLSKLKNTAGNGDRNLDVNGLKYTEEQAKNAFIVEARNAGIPVSLNPETGAIEAMQPLTAEQKLKAETRAAKYGINIGWDKGEDGSLWWKKNTYSPGAYSYNPGGLRSGGNGARGLQIDAEGSGGEDAPADIGGQAKQIAEAEEARAPHAGMTVKGAVRQLTGIPENAPIRKVVPAAKGLAKRILFEDPEDEREALEYYRDFGR